MDRRRLVSNAGVSSGREGDEITNLFGLFFVLCDMVR
jgi:hypothetical protein